MKKRNALIRVVYIWMHPVVCFSLLVATNSMVQLNTQVSEAPDQSDYSTDRLRYLVSSFLCYTILLMVTMRIMHKGVIDHFKEWGRVYHIAFKVSVAVMHYMVYYIVQNKLYFILAHSIIATITNMVEMLIPLYSKSRTVDFLFHRTTVDAAKVPGAQKELNDNRKSMMELRRQNSSRSTSTPDADADAAAAVAAASKHNGGGHGNGSGASRPFSTPVVGVTKNAMHSIQKQKSLDIAHIGEDQL
jgi:predicted ferric reductase